MATQHTSCQTLKSIAGSALVGPGLFLLFGNLDGAAIRLSHLLGAAPGEALGVLSSVIFAASFDHQRLCQGLPQMLYHSGRSSWSSSGRYCCEMPNT